MKKIDPETRAEWERQRRQVELMMERRHARERELAAAEVRRRARLRRLTFGLLGR